MPDLQQCCRHLLEHLGFADSLPKEEAQQAAPDVAAAAAALEGTQLGVSSPSGADGNAFFDNDGACSACSLPFLTLTVRGGPMHRLLCLSSSSFQAQLMPGSMRLLDHT